MSAADPAAIDAATEFVRRLAASLQVAALYPHEHPESRDRATLTAVAARDLLRLAGGLPIFLVRRGCYLGPSLLSRASLQHEPVLEACTEVGLVTVEVTAPADAADVALLIDVIRGVAPVATPITAFRLNHVMPSVHGVDTSGLGHGVPGQLATVFLRSTFDAVADGRGLDGDAVRAVAERLSGETSANPANALLLAAVAGGRDEHLAEKSVKVARLVPLLARTLGWSVATQEELALAGLVHDVGMATIDREIRHAAGRLSDEARRLLASHPVEGAGLLLEADLPGAAVEAALHHHRGVDGTGYPESHVPSPAVGRLVAVADRYAALTTRRPYRAASTPVQALQRVQSATELDPVVVAGLGRMLGAYPPGSLVRLDTGEVALVVASNPRLPTQPVVRLVLGPDGESSAPERRDLSEWGEMGFRWDVADVVEPAALGLDLDVVLGATNVGMAAPTRPGATDRVRSGPA